MLMGDRESDVSFRWEGPSNIQRRTVELLEGEEWRRRVVAASSGEGAAAAPGGEGTAAACDGEGRRSLRVVGRRHRLGGTAVVLHPRERERRETMAQGILFFSAN
jgi:hypothetical protein